MSLNPTQFNNLKAAILADPLAAPMLAAGDTVSLLAWCNAPTATAAWRTQMTPREVDQAATYTNYDSLAQGKRDSWEMFLRFDRDFSLQKNRTQVVDVWTGFAGVSNAVLAAATEFATNGQLAVAPGAPTAQSGAVTAVVRPYAALVTQEEVNQLVAVQQAQVAGG